MKLLLPLIALLAGCAAQQPAPVETSPPAAPPPVVASIPPKQENVAVAGLMDSARKDASAGKLGSAAASLERALRIEPRNPRLWHELAQVRLRQADYTQAESLAARSNTYAGSDSALRAANQKIISDARSARGQ
ncbi:MAG TPA: tetratricopeptide repeat protein [Burkholderiales bacterium]